MAGHGLGGGRACAQTHVLGRWTLEEALGRDTCVPPSITVPGGRGGGLGSSLGADCHFHTGLPGQVVPPPCLHFPACKLGAISVPSEGCCGDYMADSGRCRAQRSLSPSSPPQCMLSFHVTSHCDPHSRAPKWAVILLQTGKLRHGRVTRPKFQLGAKSWDSHPLTCPGNPADSSPVCPFHSRAD